eukprot:Tamp_20165.p1 GENE.Tamp_20165~~Tamp_20165.p1  ORF type:complete len:329 (+),score=62.26 Tamp_20165:138-989(+)
MSLAAMPDRQRSSLVLPSVTKRGSLTDVVGWLVAMLTCSIKARKQMLLDQQLFMAAALGETELCLSLIDDGADVLAETDDGGDDPRYAFAELYGLQFYEEAEKAQALESVGKVRDPRETKAPSLKPPKRQAAARSALRWAAYNGHVETVQALIRRGSDVNAGDTEGYTALHEAALYGHHQVVLALLDLKAHVNSRTDEGWMPLHLSAAYGYLDIVKTLQIAGADLCATTNGGLTAMDWAKAYGFLDTSEFLRTCSGDRHGNCEVCGRCNFFIQGGIATKVSSM